MNAITLPPPGKELLKIALDDLELCENDPDYRIDLNEWHSPNANSERTFCNVCLAGSVMAKTLRANETEHLYPDQFEWDTCQRLLWLNRVRIQLGFDRYSPRLKTEIRRLLALPDAEFAKWLPGKEESCGRA